MHGDDADAGNEVTALFCSGRNLEMQSIVSPNPDRQPAEEQHQCAEAPPEEPPGEYSRFHGLWQEP